MGIIIGNMAHGPGFGSSNGSDWTWWDLSLSNIIFISLGCLLFYNFLRIFLHICPSVFIAR
jgi:hypothetical protein